MPSTHPIRRVMYFLQPLRPGGRGADRWKRQICARLRTARPGFTSSTSARQKRAENGAHRTRWTSPLPSTIWTNPARMAAQRFPQQASMHASQTNCLAPSSPWPGKASPIIPGCRTGLDIRCQTGRHWYSAPRPGSRMTRAKAKGNSSPKYLSLNGGPDP